MKRFLWFAVLLLSAAPAAAQTLTATLEYSQTDRIYKAETFSVTATFSSTLTTPPNIEIGGGSLGSTANSTSTTMTVASTASVWVYTRSALTGGGVDDGTFSITLTANSTSEGDLSTQPADATFQIDTVAPAAPVLSFSRGPDYVTAGSLSITADFADPIASTPALVFSVTGTGTFSAPAVDRVSDTQFVFSTTAGGISAQAGDSFSATVPATSVEDFAGNQQTAASTSSSGILDTRPPVATLTYNDADLVYKAGSFSITASFNEDITPTNASITIGRLTTPSINDVATIHMSAVTGRTVWNHAYTLQSGGDGDFEVTLSASDAAGNSLQTQPANDDFVVDTDPPGVPAVAFSKGPDFINGGALRITASFDEDLTTTRTPGLVFTGAGSARFTNITTTRVNAALYTYDVTVTGTTTATGDAYTATIPATTVIDVAGNVQADADYTQAGVVDTVIPTATIAFSQADQHYKAESYTVTVTFSESVNTPNIVVTGSGVTANNVSSTAMDATTDARVWTFNRTLVAGGDGTYTVTVSATDPSQNALAVQPANNTLTVDTTPPSAPVLTFSKGPDYISSGPLVITATFAEDLSSNVTPSLVDGISIGYPGNARLSEEVVSRVTDRIFLFSIAVSGTTTAPNGDFYRVEVLNTNVEDRAGNKQTAANAFREGFIDTVAPVATLAFSQADKIYKQENFEITATFSEPITPSSPSVAITGGSTSSSSNDLTAIAMTHVSGQTVWKRSRSIAGGGVDDGAFTVTLAGQDPAGNALLVQPLENTFVVDTVAPATPTLTFSRGPAILASGPLTITMVFGEPIATTPSFNFTASGAVGFDDVLVSRTDDQNFVVTLSVRGPSSQSGDSYDASFPEVDIEDYAGNKQASPAASFSGIIDTAQPTATLTYNDSDRVYKAGSFQVTALFAEDITPAAPTIEIAGGGASSSNDAAPTAMTQGANRRTWTYSRTVNGSGVDDGAFSVTLTAADQAANSLAAQPSANSFTVDTVSPTAPTLVFSKGPARIGSGALKITANFNEPLASDASPTLLLATPGGARFSTPSSQRTSPAQFVYSTTVTGDTNQEGDPYTATIPALGVRDIAGNVQAAADATQAGTVDTRGPQAQLSYSRESRLYNLTTFEVTATFVEDVTPTALISIAGGGPSLANDVTATAMTRVTNRLWTFGRQLVQGDDGNFTITVAGADSTGNAVTMRAGDTVFAVDTLPPTSPTVAVTQNAPGVSDRVSGSSEMGSRIRVYTDSSRATLIVTAATVGGQFDAAIGDDLYSSVFVTALDRAGNESEGTTASNDTEEPTTPVIRVTQSSRGTSDRVTGTAEPLSIVRVHESAARARLIASGSAGSLGRFDFSIGDNREAAVFVTATDTAGNESGGATGVNDIDAPPSPSVSVTQSPPGTPDRVNGTAEAGSTIRVYSSSAKTRVVTSGSALAGTYDLAIGEQTATPFVTASDAFDNESPGTTALNDVVPPAAPVASVTQSPPGAADRVRGRAEAGSTVRVYSDAVLASLLASTATTGSFDLSIGDNLADRVFVTATDAAGNQGAAAELTNDVTGPVAVFGFSAPRPFAAGPVRIGASFGETPATTPTVSIARAGGAAGVTARPMSGSGASWTFDYYVFPGDGDGIRDDSLAITVSARDLAGNTGTSSASPSLLTTLTYRLPLGRGLNLISLPAKPATSLTAQSLASLVRASFVVRTSGGRFQTWVPGLSVFPNFTLQPGEGYIVAVGAPATLVLTGATAWPATARTRTFEPGLSLVGVPSVVADTSRPPHTAPAPLLAGSELRRALGASFLATLQGRRSFTASVDTLSSLQVSSGQGFVARVGGSAPVSLDLPLPVFPGTNSAPSVTASGPAGTLLFPETNTFDLIGQASDPDGGALTYRWLQVRGPAGTLTAPSSSRTSFVAPIRGSYGFVLRATDAGGASAQTSVDVEYSNRAPSVGTPVVAPQGTLFVGSSVTLQGTGSDRDADQLTYSWRLVSMPARINASLVSSGATARLTVPAGGQGTYVAGLTVTDTAGAASTEKTTTFVAGNRAPVASFTRTDGAGTVVPARLRLDATASSDPDGDEILYSWSVSPSQGVAFSSPQAAVTDLDIPFRREGQYQVTLTVTDTGHGLAAASSQRTQTFTLTANQAPAVTVDAATPVFGQATALSATASDPENEALTYSWTLVSKPASDAAPESQELLNPSKPIASFVPSVAGKANGSADYVVQVTAVDPQGQTATARVTLRARYLVFRSGNEYENKIDGSVLVRLNQAPALLFGKTEVTNRRYALFRTVFPAQAGTPASLTQDGLAGLDKPVVGVTLAQAAAYAAFAGMRLPTEGEWLTAATGVSVNDPTAPPVRLYPWGDLDPNSDDRRANLEGSDDDFPLTSVTGAFPTGAAPESGVLDLAGNAAEWTASTGPGGLPLLRGGSHGSSLTSARNTTAGRIELDGATADPRNGFRCLTDYEPTLVVGP